MLCSMQHNTRNRENVDTLQGQRFAGLWTQNRQSDPQRAGKQGISVRQHDAHDMCFVTIAPDYVPMCTARNADCGGEVCKCHGETHVMHFLQGPCT